MTDDVGRYREPAPPPTVYTVGADALGPREREVLAGVASGLSNKEIAASMFVSVNTVKTYIRTAYRKICVTNRAQAVIWAAQHGLLRIPGVTVVVDDVLTRGAAPDVPRPRTQPG